MADYAIGNTTVVGPGTSHRIIPGETEIANPWPRISVTSSLIALPPGTCSTSFVIPLSGVYNLELAVEGKLDVVGKPQSAGVSAGSGLPHGIAKMWSLIAAGSGRMYSAVFHCLLTLDAKAGLESIADPASSGFSHDGHPAAADESMDICLALLPGADSTLRSTTRQPAIQACRVSIQFSSTSEAASFSPLIAGTFADDPKLTTASGWPKCQGRSTGHLES